MFFGEDYTLNNSSRDYCWLDLTDDEFNEVVNTDFNPLLNRSDLELKNIGLRELYIMSQPEYFYFTGKFLLNLEFYPLQVAVLKELWTHPFTLLMASRGFSKTFTLAVFCLLKMIFQPGIKIVGVGAAFRQSKLIFNYMSEIWDNAPVLRSIYGTSDSAGPRIRTDEAFFKLGKSEARFVPLGNGEKIRGLRAQILLADEFDAINVEIFQTVIEGFAAVKAKPIENMKDLAYKRRMQKLGLWTQDLEDQQYGLRNQSIISGTVGDINGNLQDYFEKYRSIILNPNDKTKFKETFGDKIPEGLNHEDFCIIRIPYEKVPEGFMDEETIAKMQATMEVGTFQAEYGCCPITDTNGFYKKSLIDGATASPKNIEKEYWPEWCPEPFIGTIIGSPKYKYVYGVDPAHSSDNFAITILEIRENHSRVVYCTAFNKKVFEDMKKKTRLDEDNYWAFCARKIRTLMLKFPTENIVIDSGGHGGALVEAFRDKDKINEEELPIWPVIDPEKPQETDKRAGLHILHVINMSWQWNSDANNYLHKDLSDKILLFPWFDSIEAGIANTVDEATISNIGHDRLDDCMLEIEEMKKELVNIVKQQTPTGKERWDTPDMFMAPSARPGERLRKDRFSSLLLANYVARAVETRHPDIHRIGLSGFSVGAIGSIEKTGFINPVKNNPHTGNMPRHLYRGISRR